MSKLRISNVSSKLRNKTVIAIAVTISQRRSRVRHQIRPVNAAARERQPARDRIVTDTGAIQSPVMLKLVIQQS